MPKVTVIPITEYVPTEEKEEARRGRAKTLLRVVLENEAARLGADGNTFSRRALSYRAKRLAKEVGGFFNQGTVENAITNILYERGRDGRPKYISVKPRNSADRDRWTAFTGASIEGLEVAIQTREHMAEELNRTIDSILKPRIEELRLGADDNDPVGFIVESPSAPRA